MKRRENTALLGCALAVCAWAMVFAALLLACGYLRPRAGAAFGPEQEALIRTGTLRIGLALLVAGVFVAWGRAIVLRDRLTLGRLLWSGATVSAAGALVLQGQLLERLTSAMPARSSAFASALFGLLGFHATHLAAGVLGLATVTLGLYRSEDRSPSALPLQLWSAGFSVLVVAWLTALPLWSRWAGGAHR